MSWLRSYGLIFMVALVLRAGWVGVQWQRGGATVEWDDERLHWQLATNLVTRFEFVSDDRRHAARMPLYPAFLAPFAAMAEFGVLPARLAQALLGAATAWIAARFARRYFGTAAGALAGWLICLDPYGVFFANLLLSEVLFTFIAVGLVATVSCVVQALCREPGERVNASRDATPAEINANAAVANAGTTRKKNATHATEPPDWVDAHPPSQVRWFPLAILGALAVHVRPSAMGWVAILWLLIPLLGRRRPAGLRVVAGCVIVFALTLLPWGLRNKQVIGDYAWLSANGGVTLYDALGPQADGSSNQSFLRERPELAGLGEAALDQRLHEMAMDEIRSDPLRVARLAWVKLLRMWNPLPNVDAYRGGWSGRISAAYSMTTIVLALMSLIDWAVRRGRSAASRAAQRRYFALCLSPILAFTLIHCIYIGSVRYRVPLMPFVALIGAAIVSPRGGNHESPGTNAEL